MCTRSTNRCVGEHQQVLNDDHTMICSLCGSFNESWFVLQLIIAMLSQLSIAVCGKKDFEKDFEASSDRRRRHGLHMRSNSIETASIYSKSKYSTTAQADHCASLGDSFSQSTEWHGDVNSETAESNVKTSSSAAVDKRVGKLARCKKMKLPFLLKAARTECNAESTSASQAEAAIASQLRCFA